MILNQIYLNFQVFFKMRICRWMEGENMSLFLLHFLPSLPLLVKKNKDNELLVDEAIYQGLIWFSHYRPSLLRRKYCIAYANCQLLKNGLLWSTALLTRMALMFKKLLWVEWFCLLLLNAVQKPCAHDVTLHPVAL